MPRPVVHIERHGQDGRLVRIYLDGVKVGGLYAFELTETVGEIPEVSLNIRAERVVWGAPDVRVD